MSLAEVTDPADLDWGALRSAADDRRDWREAWGIVGTDHVGEATPGEVYLLSVARHKSATAAALWQWRAEFKATVDGARNGHNAKRLRSAKAWRDIAPLPLYEEAWARIKGIAAWESSARAQYDERGNRRGRLQAAARDWREEFRNEFSTPTHMWIDEATLDALRQRSEERVISPGYAVRYDEESDPELYGNGRGVVGVLNNPFLSAAAQRGEITGTVTVPPSTSATVAAALERYASMTGNTMNVQADASGRIVVTPRNTNPAPRGPQTRKRR